MTAPSLDPEPAPRTALSAPESVQDPVSGTERRPGGEFGPQTGAQSLGGERAAAGGGGVKSYPKRVAIRGTVGVHATRAIPDGDAEFTACGLTVDRRAVDIAPETEATCWGCRKELAR